MKNARNIAAEVVSYIVEFKTRDNRIVKQTFATESAARDFQTSIHRSKTPPVFSMIVREASRKS